MIGEAIYFLRLLELPNCKNSHCPNCHEKKTLKNAMGECHLSFDVICIVIFRDMEIA